MTQLQTPLYLFVLKDKYSYISLVSIELRFEHLPIDGSKDGRAYGNLKICTDMGACQFVVLPGWKISKRPVFVVYLLKILKKISHRVICSQKSGTSYASPTYLEINLFFAASYISSVVNTSLYR